MLYHNQVKEYRVVYTDIRAANYDTDIKLMPVGEPQPFGGDIKGFYTILERPIGATEWEEPKNFNGRCDYGGEVEKILETEQATPKMFSQADVIKLEKSFMNYLNLDGTNTTKTFMEFIDANIEKNREENATNSIDTNNNL